MAGCTLKIEYTFIRYVPVVGAKASATSAVRHEASVTETEQMKLKAASKIDVSEKYRLVNIGLLPIWR